MKTIIVWFRNDLRLYDHPALAFATKDGDYVIPVYILKANPLDGSHASSNRNRFLLECLHNLKQSLKTVGADLIVRSGEPEIELKKLLKESKASAIYYTADYTPYALKRDKKINAIMKKESIEFRAFPGRLAVSSLDSLLTKSGEPYKVFTPFWKNWQQVGRRAIAETPSKIQLLSTVKVGVLPSLNSVTHRNDLSPHVLKGGEEEAFKKLQNFLDNDIQNYAQNNNDMALDATSRLSSYLHFGCLSPRALEDMLPDNQGARAWHRQLAWREFYHYILYKFPDNVTKEFQVKYRTLHWANNQQLLKAWQQGQTGYPIVDAAMRQLQEEGWMHNRARLIVGSFLTKDLWLNWRSGETYFMRMLIDGDESNNNGNWQWIASVGVDPAPVYRRLYNPTSQLKNFDPNGTYTRRYVPELRDVPDAYLAEPWTMSEQIQQESNCIIGKNYPTPIINHKEARVAALEQYRAAALAL
jgi:deoxyribodipyrimidine photo-lyase